MYTCAVIDIYIPLYIVIKGKAMGIAQGAVS